MGTDRHGIAVNAVKIVAAGGSWRTCPGSRTGPGPSRDCRPPLPLFAVPEPAHQPAADTVRLLIVNAQHASPGRARRQASWIAIQQSADLVIVTEVGTGPGGHAWSRPWAGADTGRCWLPNLRALTTALSWPPAARASPQSPAALTCFPIAAPRRQPTSRAISSGCLRFPAVVTISSGGTLAVADSYRAVRSARWPQQQVRSAGSASGGSGKGSEQLVQARSVLDVDGQARNGVRQENYRPVGPADQGPPIRVRAHQAGLAG